MNEVEWADVIERAQHLSRKGSSAVEIVRWLHLTLKEQLGDEYGAYSLTIVLFKAFDIDLVTARRAMGWVGLNWGGAKSDADLERLLSGLVPRIDGL